MDKKTKILFDIFGVACVGAFGWASYQMYKLLKDEKSEKMSNANGNSGDLKTIVFTLTNNTDKNQEEFLFNSRYGKNNPNVGVTPNINLFNQELSDKPKKLIKAEFRTLNSSGFSGIDAIPVVLNASQTPPTSGSETIAPIPAPTLNNVAVPTIPSASSSVIAPTSTKRNQSEAPFKIICKDASGNDSSKQYIPLIAANQYQGGITTVKFDGQVLDGECFMKYTMFPKSKLSMVLYYEDYPLSDLLDKKKNKDGLVNNMKTNSIKSERQPIKAGIGLLAVGLVGFGAYNLLQK